MENLSLAIAVVFPLFFMMVLGYILKLVNIFNEMFLKQLNNLCFKIFLPTTLFTNIYNSDFSSSFKLDLVLFSVLAVVFSFALLMIVIPIIEKDNLNRGVIIQGSFRSNFILFGIPMTISLFGADNTGITSILIAFVVPFYNLFSIIALSMYSSEKKSKASVAKSVLCNPLIIASVLGIFCASLSLKLPDLLMNSVSSVANISTPLALIVLGGSFEFGKIGDYPKLLAISTLGKLVLLPGVFLSIAIYMGYRDLELVALLAMFASPTAVSSYTMAQSMKVNDVLAGQIVVFTSLFSVASICMWITVLKNFQLF
ncbi:MAG: AEC family transporter [Eubacteriales bacterium]